MGLCIYFHQLLGEGSLMTILVVTNYIDIFSSIIFGYILDIWAIQPLGPSVPGSVGNGLSLMAWVSG